MNPDDLVTVASYPNPQEANLAKALLDEEGIAAYLVGSQVSTTLWYVGTALGGVKLQVAQRDADRAKAVLKERSPSPDENDQLEWVCDHCGADVDAGFNVCWSCGTPAGETAPQSPAAPPPEPTVPEEAPAEQRDEETAETEDGESVDELASKALKAAVFGIVFFPLLLYSLLLLLRLTDYDLSGVNLRKFYAATAIIFCMFASFLGVFWLFSS